MVHEIFPDYNCIVPFVFTQLCTCVQPRFRTLHQRKLWNLRVPCLQQELSDQTCQAFGLSERDKTAEIHVGVFKRKPRKPSQFRNGVVFGFGNHHFWVQVKVMKGINPLYNKTSTVFGVLSLGIRDVSKNPGWKNVSNGACLRLLRIIYTLIFQNHEGFHGYHLVYYTFNSMQDLDDSEWQLTQSLQKVWNSHVVLLESIF